MDCYRKFKHRKRRSSGVSQKKKTNQLLHNRIEFEFGANLEMHEKRVSARKKQAVMPERRKNVAGKC